jgi:LVIVD repeat
MSVPRCVLRWSLLFGAAPLTLPALARAQGADTTDVRYRLKAGLYDAGVAIKGLELVAHRNRADVFQPNNPIQLYSNSDLAFGGNYVYQGDFSGFQVWDISNPQDPKLAAGVACFTEQGDVSIAGHLLFVSAENRGSRLDCGAEAVQDSVSKERMMGIRIFDVSNPTQPKQVADVQTCRGSHTNTMVPDPINKGIVYIYVSGLAPLRSSTEMPGCLTGDVSDPNSALFRIEIIRVPLAHPEQARIVSSARIFSDLMAPPHHGLAVGDTANGALLRGPHPAMPANTSAADSARITRMFSLLMLEIDDADKVRVLSDSLRQMGVTLPSFLAQFVHPGGPSQCHDITAYPAMGLAAGACSGYGLLLNIKDPVHPVRVQAVADSNFAFWHSATFNNNATTLLFTDEWGGGAAAKCLPTDPIDWGADAIFTLHHDELTHVGYFKLPAAQTPQENCVAHNGSLIPVPGRDIMAQAWYQGGISIFDFTDPAHPKEIAYFDRGPIDSTKLVRGGYWAAYYYNGYLYGSEKARGLDIFKLTPTADLTQNEIDAANLVHFAQLNVQSQPKIVWPAAFPVARAYLDQLVRDNGLSADQTSAIANALDRAEQATGVQRASELRRLAAQLGNDASTASDVQRVRALQDVVRRMEPAQG